jgi:hypothetical protein
LLRRLALEAFLAGPTTDFRRLANAVAGLAAERGMLGSNRTVGPGLTSFSEPRLSNSDETDLQEVVWDLIVERVLTPGLDAMNPQWPWLRMTERGRRVAKEELDRSA